MKSFLAGANNWKLKTAGTIIIALLVGFAAGASTAQTVVPTSLNEDKLNSLQEEVRQMRLSHRFPFPVDFMNTWWDTVDFDGMRPSLAMHSPRIDTKERGNQIEISAEVPGLDLSDIEVTVSKDSLTIKGNKRKESTTKAENGFESVERSYGTFQRTISLPSSVLTDNADATLHNGVLTITLTKAPHQEQATKKLAIKAL